MDMCAKPQNKHTVVLGITGGIAAYKSCELVRLLTKKDIDVWVMMTKNAGEFVSKLTLQTLSKHPVSTDLFDLTQDQEIGHISLADSADVIIIAPATANTIAKAACGIADDVITTTLLASKANVFFAPSMNVNMYEHKATQENLSKLKDLGYHLIAPEAGELACGWEGMGRMAEPQTITEHVLKSLK
mgnify:FL=1